MLTIMSWNEKDNPDLPDHQVRADARRVKRRAEGHGPVIIGAQEFGERQDHRSVMDVFGRIRYGQVAPNEATPIIYNRRRLEVLDWGYVRCHGGIARVTPHRGFTQAQFRYRFRRTVEPFWVFATHLISKPTMNQQRGKLWLLHIEKMAATIAATAAQTGQDIYVVGDFNRHTTPSLHPRQRVLVDHWLDHVIWVPGQGHGSKVKVDQTFVMHGDLFTDHQPIGARLLVNGK